MHGSAAGLYVIAGVICAARMSAGVDDPKHVIDVMATDFEWRKHEVVDGKHQLDGTLIIVEPVLDDDENVVGYKTRTGGGNRTAYEKAARSVLAQSCCARPRRSSRGCALPDGPRRARPRPAPRREARSSARGGGRVAACDLGARRGARPSA